MVTQQIKLYMDDTALPDIRMVSGDVGREIVLYVYPNKDSTESLDLTTFELRVIFIKPDKTFVIQDYIDGIMDIPSQVGAVVGNGYYQIRLSKAGEEIYSAQGNLIIDDYILNDSMVESVAEVNGYKFPDDFLTLADLDNYVTQDEIADMATTTYVDNAISHVDTKHTYSTNEQVVGTWLNGKPIYEKTFADVITQAGTSAYNYNHNIANIDYIINIECLVATTSGGFYSLSVPNNTQNVFALILADRTKFTYRNTWWTPANIEHSYVTIRYTKTTD